MPNNPQFPLRVFYDGSCSVCASEIEHYLHLNHGGRLAAVDIAAQGFDPEPFGITRDTFMYELHVIDSGNRIYRGVDAFWAIWQAFPNAARYRIVAGIITMPVINSLARLLYTIFARIRPYLPKRHSCSNASCRIDKNARHD